MEFTSSRDALDYLSDLLIFLEDASDNEEDESISRALSILRNGKNNMNGTALGRNKVRHVSVQTDDEIDDMRKDCIVKLERKIDEFCVQLSNLENALYLSRNRVLKTKHSTFPSSVPKMIQPGKSCVPSSNSKSSGYPKTFDVTNENLEDSIMFELVKDRLESALHAANELKNSIPRVDFEKCFNIIKKEREVVETTTVIEKNILRFERSKSSVCKTTKLPHLAYSIKREKTLPTIRDSKLKPPNQVSSGGAKFGNICSVPKSKNVVKAKNSASGTSHQPHSAQEKDKRLQDLDVPTKDTGAIPKNREARSSNTTIRTQKTKKTNVKPMWR